jgi:AAA ATPase domain/Bacterial transcriptional activator domain
VVGPETLSGRAEVSLLLPHDAKIDVEVAYGQLAEAERARAERDWQRAFDAASKALPVLSADLLPTLHADWVELARRSHSELRVPALACVATAGLELGGEHIPASESAARRMIELEPLRETGHALLISALAARGDRAQALLSYDELRRMLREEIGTTPGPELRALHQKLLADEGAGVNSARETEATLIRESPRLELPTRALVQATRPLFGREPELEWLDHELGSGHAEGRTVALISGEPGIGKTRLAAEFVRRVQARGANVLWGSCHEDGFVPYEPFAELVRQYLGELRDDERSQLLERTGTDVLELVPGLRRDAAAAPPPDEAFDAGAQRYRLFDAVASLLSEAARSRPLVLVLEDLHWADPSTLNLLLHLHRVDAASPIAILATHRDGEADPERRLAHSLAELRRVARVVSKELQGLSEQHSDQLVSALSSSELPPEVGREIHAQSEGNPFFISEIVRCRIDVRGNGTGDLSDGVKDLIMRRVNALSDEAAGLLNTAAVIGREFDLGLLEDVCPYEAERTLDLIEEATRARVIEEVPGHGLRYSFCHALIREALYGGLSRARRARIHRSVADALALEADELGPAGAAELAHHLHLAIDGQDGAARALHASVRAGDHAMSQRAYEDAWGHYDRALGVLEQARAGDGERCRILLARGAAQRRSGDGPAAQANLRGGRRGGSATRRRQASGQRGARLWRPGSRAAEQRTRGRAPDRDDRGGAVASASRGDRWAPLRSSLARSTSMRDCCSTTVASRSTPRAHSRSPRPPATRQPAWIWAGSQPRSGGRSLKRFRSAVDARGSDPVAHMSQRLMKGHIQMIGSDSTARISRGTGRPGPPSPPLSPR